MGLECRRMPQKTILRQLKTNVNYLSQLLSQSLYSAIALGKELLSFGESHSTLISGTQLLERVKYVAKVKKMLSKPSFNTNSRSTISTKVCWDHIVC